MSKKIKDIILYHGSLEELNSRRQDKQYRFADEETFISTYIREGSDTNEIEEHIKRDVEVCNYDGLVNRRTLMGRMPEYAEKYFYLVEGTPIKRIE